MSQQTYINAMIGIYELNRVELLRDVFVWACKRSCALPSGEKTRFIEVTETQLRSLHEGNIARYRLRPSEFQAWQTGWK